MTFRPVAVTESKRDQNKITHYNLPTDTPREYLGSPLVDQERNLVGLCVSTLESGPTSRAVPAHIVGNEIEDYLRTRTPAKTTPLTRPPVDPRPTPLPQVKISELNTAHTQISLPGPAKDVRTGGDGRYLIVHVPSKRVLVVFDTSVAKVVNTIPTPPGEILFAAGMNDLIVVEAASRNAVRYDLGRFEKVGSGKLPVEGQPFVIAMGSASNGPLLVESTADSNRPGRIKAAFVDPITFDAVAYRMEYHRPWPGIHTPKRTSGLRASPAGTVFTSWSLGTPTVISLRGGTATVSSGPRDAAPPVPGPGGLIYSPRGIYTRQMWSADPSPILDRSRIVVPAEHGTLYLDMSVPTEPRRPISRERNATPQGRLRVTIASAWNGQPMVTVPDIGLRNVDTKLAAIFPEKVLPGYHGRTFFMPDAGQIVHIPPGEDHLVVTRFDLFQSLKNVQTSYVEITNRPPPVEPGRRFVFEPTVRSHDGKATVAGLAEGPNGMTLVDGKLTWNVPVDLAQPVLVRLIISGMPGKPINYPLDLVPARPTADKSIREKTP